MRCLERAMKRRTGFSSVTTSHNSEARERFFFTMVMVEGMFRALVARHEFISPLFQALFFLFIALFFSFFFFFFLPLVLGIDCSPLISWRLFLRVWLGVGPYLHSLDRFRRWRS